MKIHAKVKVLFPEVVNTIENYIKIECDRFEVFNEVDNERNTLSWGLRYENDFIQYICLYEHEGEGFLLLQIDVCDFTGNELEQIIWENLKLSLPFRSSISEDKQIVTIYWTKIDKIGLEYLEWILEAHLLYARKLQAYLLEKYRI
jgi:hypothetical protein